MGALDFCGNRTDHAAELARQWRRSAFRDGHLKSELAADRGYFRADEAGPDDQHAPGLGGQGRLQTLRHRWCEACRHPRAPPPRDSATAVSGLRLRLITDRMESPRHLPSAHPVRAI